MRRRHRLAASAPAAILMLAAAARALAGPAAPETARLDLSRLSSPYGQARPLAPDGVAQTALERRFARDGSGASVGFLCGLQPSAVTSGGAAAYGVDPHGRFLGAQLRLSFR